MNIDLIVFYMSLQWLFTRKSRARAEDKTESNVGSGVKVPVPD